jgi:hypothetical protein
MLSYDNPAGRLHELLRRLSEGNPNVAVAVAWAQVLGVTEAEVPLRLGAVGQLVTDVQEAVEKSGDESLVAPVLRYRDAWAGAIFPRHVALDASLSNVLPGEDALEVLALVATHLHSVASEGQVPSLEHLDALKERVADLLDAVEEADDVPDTVKHLLATRLTDVLEALNHVAIGGPNAVRLATEALVGALVINEPTTPRSRTWKQVVAVLGAVYVAFSSSPTIENSIDAWGHIFQLPAGETHSVDHQADQDPPAEPETP